jgi:glutathione S-transferase
MAVKLHRCPLMWAKVGAHPCHNVQKALGAAGIEFEVVKHPFLPRSKRTDLMARSGQNMLPAIELEDGTFIRRESKELVAMIRSGELLRQSAAE